ncbi:hypothetical protein RchiOBHm_Chr3g0486201 [Rosa chinensis]|uniref:Uncharacterized protein n=1 Tax=Rosa chinensis TaxID=74649 RepID=A0A2P6RF78_ROSCH|nr:protein PATRONUS 2 isoform X1 [Rosa chinensis]XP_024191017.1 protein PATRONUS 2 isoform X1 [Rosa chinensis]PRQ45072.1 hypothetical protein RchiOBHm_Chr3g0486201 [Rosa chinensis]
MASTIGRLFQDQNLSVHSNGNSAVGKGGAKTQKKAGFGGRKPLVDVSNIGKPDFSKVSKKPALTNVSEIIADASNKKGLSKASDKVQTRGNRKALSDVSNTVKPPVHKKSRVAAQPPCGFEEEGFLHDHQQCIKSMRKANHMDQMDFFMMIQGSDSSKKLLSPCAASQFLKVELDSPMKYLDLKEMPELSIKLDSSPHCKSPLSPNHTKSSWVWDDCDFQVMETP